MNLSSDEVKHIASLAKIAMSDSELKVIGSQLSQILDQFRSLSTLNTENIEITAHPTSLNTVLRTDDITNSKADKSMLDNAPRKEGDFVRVRSVLE
ncbi:MAG: Asp-tRNA(Asn)/Glu-tRNA(Gln) amidotransferase GatCAB subunit C [Dehalococcoidia bacterium]|nr:Asp-tRNA(Asn)/Glu-tRNA(Gln) amidotransferase GatCAB subunit C [Dehalococcoidia bacterium]MQG15435.1 Asp-tRNA(Asn)/Glu-tRNA(Gln) amidotransferase subunit GatC [SAR202 cluster bacterium]|tara:strand:- start:333 stop:620 length:288 start_codon:yes stop_codon:yes gene_type:complete